MGAFPPSPTSSYASTQPDYERLSDKQILAHPYHPRVALLALGLREPDTRLLLEKHNRVTVKLQPDDDFVQNYLLYIRETRGCKSLEDLRKLSKSEIERAAGEYHEIQMVMHEKSSLAHSSRIARKLCDTEDTATNISSDPSDMSSHFIVSAMLEQREHEIRVLRRQLSDRPSVGKRAGKVQKEPLRRSSRLRAAAKVKDRRAAQPG